jgi:hypothetical protein
LHGNEFLCVVAYLGLWRCRDPAKGNGRVQSGLLAGPLNLRRPAKQGSCAVTCKSGGTQKQPGSALRAKAKKGSDVNPEDHLSDDQSQSFDRVRALRHCHSFSIVMQWCTTQ